jgi:hypothetical protein
VFEPGSLAGVAFGLCAHATVTPLVGNPTVPKITASVPTPASVPFLVTTLTPGSSYNYDLMFAGSSAVTLQVLAIGQTSVNPNLSSGAQGAPILMTVQAV